MSILSRVMRGTRWERLVLQPIGTERLSIAPLELGDAEEVRAVTDDPAITGAVEFLPKRFGIEDARSLIRSAENGRNVFLGFRGRADGVLVGVMGTHLRALEAIEIGYWIAGSARGRGFAAEGVGGVVRTLAEAYPRRAIVAECRPENIASWNLLHRIGFRPTGDSGERPGRKLMIWDVRNTARAPTAS